MSKRRQAMRSNNGRAIVIVEAHKVEKYIRNGWEPVVDTPGILESKPDQETAETEPDQEGET